MMCGRYLPRTPSSPPWSQKTPQTSLGGRRAHVQLEQLYHQSLAYIAMNQQLRQGHDRLKQKCEELEQDVGHVE